MNYLVLSNRVLLLENHWMLFHGKEKIKTNKPPKHRIFKKKERDLEEVSAWLKRAPTETSSEICLITKVLIWREQHEKSNTWFTEASLITHHVPPHPPTIPWEGPGGWPDCGRRSLAHLMPRCCPCSRGPSPLFLFWTTAHFHHSLEFKVEAWGRPMLFAYQSLKNYWIKIASSSCDPGFQLLWHTCTVQGKENLGGNSCETRLRF